MTRRMQTELTTHTGSNALPSTSPPQFENGYKYNGFISYRHDANQREIARRLQIELHKFAKPFYRLRAVRLYRDETNLSLNPDLWSEIESALDNSRYFILLASPASAQSRWVKKELKYWLTTRDVETLIVILTDGTIRWNPLTEAFDAEETTAIPLSIHSMFKVEPKWLDMRWVSDTKKDLRMEVAVFRDAVATISASLRSIDKDKIYGEDVKQQRRTKRMMLAAISTITLFFMLATLAAVAFFLQRKQTAIERDSALARLLAAEGHRRSIIDSVAGTKYFLSSLKIETNPSAISGLFRNLQTNPHIAMQFLVAKKRPTAVTARGHLNTAVVGLEDGGLLLWEFSSNSTAAGEMALRNQQPIKLLPGKLKGPVVRVSLDEESHVTAIDSQGGMYKWLNDNGELLNQELLTSLPIEKIVKSNDGAPEISLSANGGTAAWATWKGIHVWTKTRGVFEVKFPGLAVGGPLSLSENGRYLATTVSGTDPPAIIYDLEKKSVIHLPAPPIWLGVLDQLQFSPDGNYIAGTTSSFDGTLILWRLEPIPRFIRQVNHPKKNRPNITPQHQRLVFDEKSEYLSSFHRMRWHIWDLDSGILIGDPINAKSPVSAYLGGRQRLLISTEDNTIKIIDHSFEHLKYWACLSSDNTISEADWRDLIGMETPIINGCE